MSFLLFPESLLCVFSIHIYSKIERIRRYWVGWKVEYIGYTIFVSCYSTMPCFI